MYNIVLKTGRQVNLSALTPEELMKYGHSSLIELQKAMVKMLVLRNEIQKIGLTHPKMMWGEEIDIIKCILEWANNILGEME